MQKVVVRAFGDGVDVLEVVDAADPSPGAGEVVVRLTSIGMNHAELMQRRGHYRMSSGEPPFTPGMEGGGVIESVGEGVTDRTVGQRVALGLDAPRGPERMGTYTTHYVLPADRTVVVPDAVDETVCGALWLAYLTAWGCLVWKHGMREGDVVLIPAASSAVGLTASQVVKEHGGVAIGTTTSPEKVEHLRAMPEAMFDHIVCTAGSDTDPDEWRREVKDLSGGHGVDIAFDPVAAGAFLSAEIRALAEGGTIHVYGLLGKPGPVDVTPLIMKRGAIRGYLNMELVDAGADALDAGYAHVLARIADRRYVLPVARTFALSDVRDAHEYMEKGRHIGKLILVP